MSNPSVAESIKAASHQYMYTFISDFAGKSMNECILICNQPGALDHEVMCLENCNKYMIAARKIVHKSVTDSLKENAKHIKRH